MGIHSRRPRRSHGRAFDPGTAAPRRYGSVTAATDLEYAGGHRRASGRERHPTPGRIAMTGAEVLVLGTWFALIAGLSDAFLFFVTSVLLGRYNYLYPDLVWISPVSNIILFALPGVILWALARWRPAPYWRFVTVGVFAFLTGWGLTGYATRLHPAAAVILVLGIALQTARVIAAHPRGTNTLVRYTLPAMAAAAIIGGLALNGWARFSERRAIADLPPAAQGSPNILLI